MTAAQQIEQVLFDGVEYDLQKIWDKVPHLSRKELVTACLQLTEEGKMSSCALLFDVNGVEVGRYLDICEVPTEYDGKRVQMSQIGIRHWLV